MFGRSFLFPTDMAAELLQSRPLICDDASYCPDPAFDLAWNAAKDHEQVSRQRTLAQHRRKRGRKNQSDLAVSDSVLLLSPDESARWKDRPQKLGPYPVTAVRSDGNVEIQRDVNVFKTYPLRFLERAPRKRSRASNSAPALNNPSIDGSLVPPPTVTPSPVVVNAELPLGVFQVDSIVGAEVERPPDYTASLGPAMDPDTVPGNPLLTWTCEHLVKSFEDTHPQDLSNSVLSFSPELDAIASVRSFKRGST
jgi:hypothetical protein